MLASRFGFDAEEVWQHELNRELRASRASPNVLAPGDVLHIPEAPARPMRLARGTTNRYEGSLPRVPIRLQLELGDRPLADEPCVVTGAMETIETSTDGEGMLSIEIAPHVSEVHVEVARRGLRFRALVGRLDPRDQESGVFERLVNLGYVVPEARMAGGEARRARLRRALTAFQRDRGIDPTGELDTETLDALRDAHRC
ncbi:peptidoglycan-binding domain-containing protein [Sorangium sp. So ce233]|uniref:peptidoglycan-binding domain-containing protein n=1 Tax=Sorangium sp. So ce233 TaxID=3133290 RepID=UPI003F62F806